ncbi:LysM peptidoglycan-binding domain-containing M23 family metallopeptidase [Coleofasciculus sp. F4-SAH-05]|uniref:LysM peptidoglycan-binding domain-containing M23 family metallopeptidase n=1 Tax=Coleofasciculus TaxID=669368 RepID=UPI0032F30B76
MTFHRWLPIFSTVICLVAPISNPATAQSSSPSENSCPAPALSRLQKHKVAPGETLDSIAQRYSLIPETLAELNPSLSQKSMPVGREILIPPFNGIRVQVPAGASWQDLAEAYGIRADILFEVNGCLPQPPDMVFVSGVNWVLANRKPVENYTGFAGYPLPAVAPMGFNYGWHQNGDGQTQFHSGIDLLADPGTTVLAVDSGTVAFAGQQGTYGNLVVINHQGGRQTRYAHLSRLSVRTGQRIKPGTPLGAVGTTGSPDIDQPHLHFEVRFNAPAGWVAQDPELHLTARPINNE